MKFRHVPPARCCAAIIALIAAAFSLQAYPVVPFSVGDVFAGVGRGKFNHFSPTGVLLETLDDGQAVGSGEDATTGMCFDSAGNMYGTNLDKSTMSKFSNNGTLLAATFGSFSGPESCLIVGGSVMYVSQVFAPGNILKVNLSGTQLANYATPRSDWIDLASDQCTMFYTDEGSAIHRFNVCTNAALPDFVTVPGASFYALRILPSGDVLVAAGPSVRRFNSGGTEILPAYTAAGETFFFALNLDPDGTHFWSGGITSGMIYKFNLAPVGAPVLSFSSQIATAGGTILAGLAVFGENIAANGRAPTIAKTFGSQSIGLNGSTSLSFTLGNPNSTPLTSVTFSDLLPAGLSVSTPNGLSGTCGGGVINAIAGTATISLSGATLAGNASCTFSVNVTGTSPGTKNNITSPVSALESGVGGTASASLVVGTPVNVPTLQQWAPWLLGMLVFVVTAGMNRRKAFRR